MIIHCPFCGPRDLREFTIKGAALARPQAEASAEAWHDYVHMRDNQPGASEEFWHHSGGCGSWLVVARDNTTHAIHSVTQAAEWALKGDAA